MPFLTRDFPSVGPRDNTFIDDSISRKTRIIDNHEYAALSAPGYAEKPLDEQLEPIAVVGMGTLIPFLNVCLMCCKG